MIVSHKYQFIFLHSLKTGGSAVTLSLLRGLDKDDLWLTAPIPDIMSDALSMGFVPAPATHASVRKAVKQQHGRKLLHKALKSPQELDADERAAFTTTYMSLQEPHPRPTWQHVFAKTAREYLGKEVWNSYFKFSFDRNPWDRLVSLYWWRFRKYRDTTPPVSFSEFVDAIHSGDRQRIKKHRAKHYSNWRFYTINNEPAVDHLGRYESLADEFQSITGKVGIPITHPLPNAKGWTRKSAVGDIYDRHMANLVGEIFRPEIELLGYTPPADIAHLVDQARAATSTETPQGEPADNKVSR